jgi:hypothetical protein
MRYLDYKTTVAVLVKKLRDAAVTAGVVVVGDTLLYNFDAAADSAALPDNKHIFGQKDFSVVEEDGTVEIEVMIGVATYDDTNLIMLDKVMDIAFEMFRSGKQHALVDTTGAITGRLTCKAGTTVFPVDRTKIRPRQFLGLRLGTDRLAPSA